MKQNHNRFAPTVNSSFILLHSSFLQRHGGDGRFSRHRFAGVRAQGACARPSRGKSRLGSRTSTGAGDDPRYFQISVPVQPGNSGGALVDERGNVIGIVSAKLGASVALAASGALPENVNYAVKSSLLLSFLESVPDVNAKLKTPNTGDEKFEDVVKSAQDAAVLVLVY